MGFRSLGRLSSPQSWAMLLRGQLWLPMGGLVAGGRGSQAQEGALCSLARVLPFSRRPTLRLWLMVLRGQKRVLPGRAHQRRRGSTPPGSDEAEARGTQGAGQHPSITSGHPHRRRDPPGPAQAVSGHQPPRCSRRLPGQLPGRAHGTREPRTAGAPGFKVPGPAVAPEVLSS